MKYFIFSISLFVVFACEPGSNSPAKNVSNDLIDKVVGKYNGSFKYNSTKAPKSCQVEITKISSEQIQIDASSCLGQSVKLLLDKSKSSPHSMIFRNREGKVIARCMSKTFSYQLPLSNGEVENFNGIKEEKKR